MKRIAAAFAVVLIGVAACGGCGGGGSAPPDAPRK